MPLRIPMERISPFVLFLQAFRSMLCGAVILIVFFTIAAADSSHQYLFAVASALRDWIHAALNQ